MRQHILAVALVALAAGCSPENSVDRNAHTDTFLQEPVADVDILWVIDNSVSMASEQQLVADGFESFISTIEDTNINFQIGVVTTDMDATNPDAGVLLGEPAYLTSDDDYIPLFEERIQVGTEGSDHEKGLAAALEALTEPKASGVNDGFLRPDAVLSIIFVSDEDDCSDDNALDDQDGSACYQSEQSLIPVKDFIDDFRDLKAGTNGRVIASGILGPNASEGCDETWPGHRYDAVAQGLGGIVGSICDANYSEIMDQMGLAVSGVLSVFQLEYVPVVESLEVAVDDELIGEDPVNGWTYDDEYYTIRFDGDYVPPRGTSVSITYEVAGSILSK